MRSINGQIEFLLRDALRQRLGRDPAAPRTKRGKKTRGKKTRS